MGGRRHSLFGGREENRKKRKLAGSGKHADTSASGPTGIRIPGHLGFGIALRKRAQCNPHMLSTWAFQKCATSSFYSLLFFFSLSLTSNFIFPESNLPWLPYYLLDCYLATYLFLHNNIHLELEKTQLHKQNCDYRFPILSNYARSIYLSVSFS